MKCEVTHLALDSRLFLYEGKHLKITMVHLESMTHIESWNRSRFNGGCGRNYHLKSETKDEKVQFNICT